MKNIFKLLTILFLTLTCFSCNNSKNEQNALYNITYRDIHEVAQLKGYESMGGSVLENPNDKSGNSEFGISLLNDSSKNKNIITLEKFVEGANPSQPNYQILDTINIDNLKPGELIVYCTCSQGKTFNQELIALVIDEVDKDYTYNKIIKAWRADTKTGKIVRIENTKGISCDVGFDPSGCDDYSDSTTVSPK